MHILLCLIACFFYAGEAAGMCSSVGQDEQVVPQIPSRVDVFSSESLVERMFGEEGLQSFLRHPREIIARYQNLDQTTQAAICKDATCWLRGLPLHLGHPLNLSPVLADGRVAHVASDTVFLYRSWPNGTYDDGFPCQHYLSKAPSEIVQLVAGMCGYENHEILAKSLSRLFGGCVGGELCCWTQSVDDRWSFKVLERFGVPITILTTRADGAVILALQNGRVYIKMPFYYCIFLGQLPGQITALACDGGHRIAAGLASGGVHVWDGNRDSGFEGHVGKVTALAFLPDGRLVSAGVDGTVRISRPGLCAASDPLILKYDEHVTIPLGGVSILPDLSIAVSDTVGTVRIWRPTPTNGYEPRHTYSLYWSHPDGWYGEDRTSVGFFDVACKLDDGTEYLWHKIVPQTIAQAFVVKACEWAAQHGRRLLCRADLQSIFDTFSDADKAVLVRSYVLCF